MSRTVFVVNSGSSSIKYQLIDLDTEEALASGLVERIGEPLARLKHTVGGQAVVAEIPVPDHVAGMAAVMDAFAAHGPDLAGAGVVAVGHRVVQGGDRFDGPVLVTDEVEAAIGDLAGLAPLHNPANLQGIRAARVSFPDVPHVAVFDTAFHRTLPPEAYTYAIDPVLAARHGIRRYGFHGTSHQFVAGETARFLGRDPQELNLIVLHLGNGASATAVRGGVSVETSMGLTPLEGLVMGTRCGDIDPAVIPYLQQVENLTTEEVDALLNRRSGMLGMTGSNDLRDAQARAGAGDPVARLALDVYTHRIRHYVGAYYAQLGRVDAVVFTAGVGENDDRVRLEALRGLEAMGIAIDPARNVKHVGAPTVISPEGSPVAVLVVPTNEELQIARQAAAFAG